jgi:hypothetical protein
MRIGLKYEKGDKVAIPLTKGYKIKTVKRVEDGFLFFEEGGKSISFDKVRYIKEME